MSAKSTLTQKELLHRVQKLSTVIKEQENNLRIKANYLNEHKFTREEAHVRLILNTIQEIRFEVDSIESSQEYRPRFNF